MIYFEAPLSVNPPAGGAIGRGRGRVRKTGRAENDRTLKLIRRNIFGNQFPHSLSSGDPCIQVTSGDSMLWIALFQSLPIIVQTYVSHRAMPCVRDVAPLGL